MLRSVVMVARLVTVARILARHRALDPLAQRDIAPRTIAFLQWLFARRDKTGATTRPKELPKELPGERSGERPGERLANALIELGPSYIKLGQVLSTRADLLGNAMAEDLSLLQDRLPPFDGDQAKRIIESELGQPVADCFAEFAIDPISAASIAQVHLATTSEGRPVAVKVLRPGIEKAFERDLALFYWLAGLADRFEPRLARFKPTQVVALFEDIVRAELDLRLEAAAATELGENFATEPSYSVPGVDWDRTSRQVLTLDRVAGIPMDDRDALLAAGHDLEVILTRAAAVFFQQVFRDGFFHGDQHPGNMMVAADGAIVVVDFGIMGRLDLRDRRFLADMLVATLARDYHRLAEVYAHAGYLPADADNARFSQALRAVCEPIIGRPLNEISFARLLGQLLGLAEAYALPVQPQLLLLQKNMLIAEGISRRLVPELNIWTLARPMVEDWVREHRGPEARLRESATALLGIAERLPETLEQVERITRRVANDGFTVAPESLAAFTARAGRGRWREWVLWAVVALLLAFILVE